MLACQMLSGWETLMKIYLKLIMKYEIFDGKFFLSGKYFLFYKFTY